MERCVDRVSQTVVEAVVARGDRDGYLTFRQQDFRIVLNRFCSHADMRDENEPAPKVIGLKNAHQPLAFDISPF